MRRLISPILLVIAFTFGAYFLWNRLPWLQQNGASSSNVQVDEPVSNVKLEPPASYETAPTVGFLAPDFELPTISGKEERLSDHLGTPVVLTFWQTRCPFCISNLAIINRTVLLRRSPVVVFAINKGEPTMTVQEFVQSHDPLPSARILVDIDEAISKKFAVDALPRTIFIDALGVVRETQVGELSADQITAALDGLLGSAK